MIRVWNADRFLSLLITSILLTLCGCQKKAELSATGAAAGQIAVAGAAAPARAPNKIDTLAYEHTVAIELSDELLPRRLREVEAACIADEAAGCSILDVSLSARDQLPSGSIRMRLAPGGVEPLIGIASKDGEVVGRTSHAEDLAEPVADANRQLALMTVHRDRLTEFLKSKELKIDQLITVSKELADVQSQIDALGTQRATLQRRIDTDLLTINFALPATVYAANQSPISEALRDFGHDFRHAIGMMIRFLAVMIPWLVIILPGLFLLRLFWRWMGRKLTKA